MSGFLFQCIVGCIFYSIGLIIPRKSPYIYLLAAHCITDVYGKMLNKEDYLVAVGKHYRKYDDPRDSNHSQTSVVSWINNVE
jgi:hypothetical protein